MTGRHYNILFIITMQYPLGIPPALRTNLDYVFLFRENINSFRATDSIPLIFENAINRVLSRYNSHAIIYILVGGIN